MAKFALNGRDYPLRLTVAVIDELAARGVNLSGIMELFQSELPEAERSGNVLWLLHVLMCEGLANARLTGCSDDAPKIPEVDELRHLLTPGRLMAAQTAILQTIAEDMRQEIEAVHEKN